MATIIKGLKGKDLLIKENDPSSRKLAMLFEGHCTIGVKAACQKYGYTEQRYYQLLKKFNNIGSDGLIDKKRGSDKKPVLTKEVTNQIIRLRFLDPLASTDVLTQKMQQESYNVSKRSVERVITEYGLKKNSLLQPGKGKAKERGKYPSVKKKNRN